MMHDRLVALRAALSEASEGAGNEGAKRNPRVELMCVVHDDVKSAIYSLRGGRRTHCRGRSPGAHSKPIHAVAIGMLNIC